MRPVLSVSTAPEGDVHQALAAGDQLRVGAPTGKGGTGFILEAKEVEEEGDRNLGISGSVSHLEETEGADSESLLTGKDDTSQKLTLFCNPC